MAIETAEGDFVVRSSHQREPLLRIQMTDESMVITATETGMGRQVIVADISEAKQLRDWITRRLGEPV